MGRSVTNASLYASRMPESLPLSEFLLDVQARAILERGKSPSGKPCRNILCSSLLGSTRGARRSVPSRPSIGGLENSALDGGKATAVAEARQVSRHSAPDERADEAQTPSDRERDGLSRGPNDRRRQVHPAALGLRPEEQVIGTAVAGRVACSPRSIQRHRGHRGSESVHRYPAMK
jgi:hypothetical protein